MSVDATCRVGSYPIVVGDVPAFAVGGDVSRAPDPYLTDDRIVRHLPGASRPLRLEIDGTLAELPYSVGDALCSIVEPTGEFGVLPVYVVRVGGGGLTTQPGRSSGRSAPAWE
jgi:hypothetical protein